MKIAIVNDVPLIAEALRRVVINTREHQVLWVAHSGAQAVRACAENRPDLLLMDMVMPGMDGVETTRSIMREAPCAVLIVTASPEDNTSLVFRALGAGALDVTATPVLAGASASDSALLAKIRTIGKLIAADRRGNGAPLHSSGENGSSTAGPAIDTLIAIGASTGGPIALAKILKEWHPSPRSAAVIVQHIDQDFADSFARWLGEQVEHPIDVIEDGSHLTAGRIHIAKTNDHLAFDSDQRMRYSPTPVDYPYRPSIDVFFHCIAEHWRKKAVGILLTGMGRDGARGLLAMRRAKKLTIAQDQATSAVYGMPRAAAEMQAAELILPLERISAILHSNIV